VISDQFNIPSGPVLGVHLTGPMRRKVWAMTSVIFYRRRLTARAMIRSRVSSVAGNCLTISPS